MHIVIYGAGGQLGTALQAVCEHKGIPFTPVSRQDGFRLAERPLAIPPLPAAATHAVVCSSVTNMDACFRDPQGTRTINVEGTVLLLEHLLAQGIRPVFCSSDVVFRGDRGAYVEADPPDPVLEYGRQKLEVESWLARNAPHSLTVRMSKLYSLARTDTSPIGGVLRALREGQVVRAALDQLIVPTRLEDVAGHILGLLTRDATGTFHLAPGPEGWYTRYTLAMTLAALLGRERLVQPCRLADLPVLEPRPANNTLLAHRATELLGAELPPLSAHLGALRADG